MNGVVRVGAPEDIGERILPEVLKRFSESYPNVTVDVTIGTSSVMRKRVDEHRMDIAIFNSMAGENTGGGEILVSERLVWAGTKCGTAHTREPLPISMWEDGCVWRADAVEQLTQSGRKFRVAFLSAHTTGQRAAIQADLAIAPLPRYLVQGDLVALGEAEGLPELGHYNIGLQVVDNASPPVLAVAGTRTHRLRRAAIGRGRAALKRRSSSASAGRGFHRRPSSASTSPLRLGRSLARSASAPLSKSSKTFGWI